MVCSDQIQFRKNGRTMEGSGEIVDMRDRVVVRNSHVVKGMVVPTRSPIPRSLLGDHVEGR